MPWWLTVFGLYIGGPYALMALGVLGARAWRRKEAVPMKARLEGGPFDGDTGELMAPAGVPMERPGELHTVRCRASACAKGGVHWWADRATARDDARRNHTTVYRYRFARDDAGALVYVYADLTEGGRSLLAREHEPVRVG